MSELEGDHGNHNETHNILNYCITLKINLRLSSFPHKGSRVKPEVEQLSGAAPFTLFTTEKHQSLPFIMTFVEHTLHA